jgi:hypothetical protein
MTNIGALERWSAGALERRAQSATNHSIVYRSKKDGNAKTQRRKDAKGLFVLLFSCSLVLLFFCSLVLLFLGDKPPQQQTGAGTNVPWHAMGLDLV